MLSGPRSPRRRQANAVLVSGASNRPLLRQVVCIQQRSLEGSVDLSDASRYRLPHRSRLASYDELRLLGAHNLGGKLCVREESSRSFNSYLELERRRSPFSSHPSAFSVSSNAKTRIVGCTK